jgi:hypothetical protein
LTAQFKFAVGSQGAWPLLHEAQLTLLICQSPTSVDPFVLWFRAFALPPDSWDTIHLQHDWFQLCFAHHVPISYIFFVVPQ